MNSGNNCTCGVRFMDAEDFRDHLPCSGSARDRLVEKQTVDKIVKWLRTDSCYARFSIEGFWAADAIEKGEWKNEEE